jgi:hypothetical protein
MAIEENINQAYIPPKSAYGRIIRERGTLRLVIAAIVLFVAWYIYATIRANMLLGVKWPDLKPSKAGLIVLGLKDKDRPGWKHKYEARESNHSWQIRRPDDASADDDGANLKVDDPSSPAGKERPNAPAGASRMGAQGEVVPLEELLANLPVVLNGSNFSGASVEERHEPLFDRRYYLVHVDLTDEGRSRYFQFSREHSDERLVFILDGEIMTCPRMDHMYVSSLTIEPIWVKADADKLADFINKQGK